MAVSALVERRGAQIVHVHPANENPNWTMPMSVMWLVLPLAATGLVEEMHFRAVTGAVRRLTTWLPDNVNKGKMENVFWMLAVLGAVNFGYYFLYATFYKYRSREITNKKLKFVSFEK